MKRTKEKAVSMRPKMETTRSAEEILREAKTSTLKKVVKTLTDRDFETLSDHFMYLRETRLVMGKDENLTKALILEYMRSHKQVSAQAGDNKVVNAIPRSTPKIDAWEIWQELKSRELGAQLTQQLFNKIFRVNVGEAKSNLGADVVEEWDFGETNPYAGVEVKDL